jgi:hypothetical protein
VASRPALQWVRTRSGRRPQSRSTSSAARRDASRLTCSSSSKMASASASTASGPSDSRVSARRTPQERFAAVGRAAASRAASSRTMASSLGWRRADCATPSAPAAPSAGAPRMASRLIASTRSSTVVNRSWRYSRGSAVWSIITIALASQSIVRSTDPPATLRSCSGLVSLALQLAPAAGAVIGNDLLEHLPAVSDLRRPSARLYDLRFRISATLSDSRLIPPHVRQTCAEHGPAHMAGPIHRFHR